VPVCTTVTAILFGHRPGFFVSDAFTTEERQRIRDAYDAYERDLTTAWKRGAV